MSWYVQVMSKSGHWSQLPGVEVPCRSVLRPLTGRESWVMLLTLQSVQLYMLDHLDLRFTWVLYIDPEGPLHHVLRLLHWLKYHRLKGRHRAVMQRMPPFAGAIGLAPTIFHASSDVGAAWSVWSAWLICQNMVHFAYASASPSRDHIDSRPQR